MTFKCRFNATCFLFKINRFVLIFSKTSNRFVLKICSGGFADYTNLSYFSVVICSVNDMKQISNIKK